MWLFGEGKELNRLKKQYKNIIFTGWKKENEVYSYMKNAEALIVPSIWYECAGLTILEAQFLNTPCIISNYCSKKEFLKKGCDYENIDDLKKCIVEKKYLNEYDVDLMQFLPKNYINYLINYYESE